MAKAITWGKWLFDRWGMTELKINAHFLEMKWEPQDYDRDAAWELYAELLTRITTQALSPERGDEKAALDSVYSIFPTTRDILKRRGRHAAQFTKLAIVVLNQVIRPFTAKWHRLSLTGAFQKSDLCTEFRRELQELQPRLIVYARMLSDMAAVEDLTTLEDTSLPT